MNGVSNVRMSANSGIHERTYNSGVREIILSTMRFEGRSYEDDVRIHWSVYNMGRQHSKMFKNLGDIQSLMNGDGPVFLVVSEL